MLNSMTRGTLHLASPRTAKMEYDAYNVDMNEARARFAECYRIVEKGFGEPSPTTGHSGRSSADSPAPEPVAKKCVSTAPSQSGQRRSDGDLGVRDLPLDLSRQAAGPHLERCGAAERGQGRDPAISVKMSSPTPTRRRRARPALLPAYFDLQCTHYESDANRGRISRVPGLQPHVRQPAQAHRPAELGPFMDSNLVGSPATICRRIDSLRRWASTTSWCRRHARHADRTAPAHDDALCRGSVPALLARDATEAGA